MFYRCERCGCRVFPCINAGVCGCELVEYWMLGDGDSEETAYMYIINPNSIDVAERIAEYICKNSPELYDVFIENGIEISVKYKGEIKKYYVKAKQVTKFFSREIEM